MSSDLKEIMQRLVDGFHADNLERLLECHVSVVELHSLVDRGELRCDGWCRKCLPSTHPAHSIKAMVKNEQGMARRMTPELWSQIQAAKKSIDNPDLLLDHKRMPVPTDMAPCTFDVADAVLFEAWLKAKISQRDRHRLSNEERRELKMAELAAAGVKLTEDEPS